MKTKVAYVLVSSPDDVYLEQAYVSMMSLRHHDPDAHISLVTDKLTADTFIGVRKEMVRFVDELVTVDLPESIPPMKRSRILKTSLRSRISGDYLYIDVDTVIVRSLADIDDIGFSVAACEDSHIPFKDSPYHDGSVRLGKILGWPIEEETLYFNGGVHYVKDDDTASEFYSRWNTNYLSGYDLGIKADQPSLALSNYQMGHVIGKLDDVWNCQLKHGIRYLKDAKVVHYLHTSLSGAGKEQLFVMNEPGTYDKLKTGDVDPRIIASFDDPFTGLSRFSLALGGNDAKDYTRFRIIDKKDLSLLDDKLARMGIKTAAKLREIKSKFRK